MNIPVNRDTVTIDESVHGIYKELTDGSDPITVPFKTMKDIFLWAASLGYKRGERRPIAGKKLTIFRWAQFSSQVDIPLIKAFSLVDANNINVLISYDEMLTNVEEYANAGIHDLRTRLLDEQGQPLWKIVELLG